MHERSTSPRVLALLLITLGPACATFRSDVEGRFDSPGSKNTGADKVSVLFILRHERQATGLDEIPKLDSEDEIVKDFDDLFLDAMTELGNVEDYATFTEFASDVSKPERREKRDELISESDFVVRIDFMKRHSFIKHSLGYIVSTLSLTLVPVPYSQSFSVEVKVHDADGDQIQSYRRSASLTRWLQILLIFLQPFHDEAIKKEQIYIEFLRDVFKQMETEGVLIRAQGESSGTP